MKKLLLGMLAIICSSQMLLAEEDTRTVITSAVFTGTIPTLEDGDTWNYKKRNEVGTALVAENPVYYIYDSSSSSFSLQRKNADDSWSDLDYFRGDVITAGTYRFNSQLRIAGEAAQSYRLPDPTKSEAKATLTVAGEEWVVGNASVFSTFSYAGVNGPEFTIERKMLPFEFHFNSSLNYGIIIINNAATAKDLKNYTTGGSGEYTYEKLTKNVPWLTVTSDGILGGTPTVVNKTLATETFQVSDGVNDPITFEIKAGLVAPVQSERTVIESASYTGWVTPAIGDVLTASYRSQLYANLTPEDGAVYHLEDASNMDFLKKSGDVFDLMADNDEFTVGEYKCNIQIRCDDTNGWFYILANESELTVTMDGENLNVSSGDQGNGFSYRVISYLFTISEPTNANETSENATLSSSKVMIDGKLYIITPEGHIYSINGAMVK